MVGHSESVVNWRNIPITLINLASIAMGFSATMRVHLLRGRILSVIACQRQSMAVRPGEWRV